MQFERISTIVAISVFSVLILRFLGTKVADYLIDAMHRWFPDTDPDDASIQRGFDNICKLSHAEARNLAIALLADEERFVCSPPTDEPPQLSPIRFGPAASELFSRFLWIETPGGEVLLGPNAFRSESTETYQEIGATEDGAVYLMPCSDVIYERSAERRELVAIADTVYHWLLMVDLMFHDDKSFTPNVNEDLPADGGTRT